LLLHGRRELFGKQLGDVIDELHHVFGDRARTRIRSEFQRGAHDEMIDTVYQLNKWLVSDSSSNSNEVDLYPPVELTR